MLTGISDTDKVRLINSFPSSLRQDLEEAIKVLPADHNVLSADGQIHNIDSLIHPTEHSVILEGEQLTIPYRNYFNEPTPEKEKLLTPLQRTILNCIYLRHHNGFVRQKRLEQLVDSDDYFIVPYTFQLLGEYVREILEVLDRHVNDKTMDNYSGFVAENKKYWQQTEARMISYWNEYYRNEFSKLKEYIGKKIVDRIKANAQHLALRKLG